MHFYNVSPVSITVYIKGHRQTGSINVSIRTYVIMTLGLVTWSKASLWGSQDALMTYLFKLYSENYSASLSNDDTFIMVTFCR